ncbi:MAG: tetratricopeptide repeat-containing sensor histidine kinase [Bernardetiaceae bacterium]|nr:tetratricopeptide repeat-containing sensor histidine kinase [Bernardetiaceae bacterium]
MILLLVGGWANGVWGQLSKIDSLHRLLHQEPAADTNRVNRLVLLAYRHYQSYPDSTLLYAQQALNLARKLDFRAGEGRAVNRLAVGHSVKGDFSQAVKLYLESLKIAEELGDLEGVARVLNNVGYIYRLLKQYDRSFEYTYRATAYGRRLNNPAALAVNFTNLGWLHSISGNVDSSLYYGLQGVRVADAVGDLYHASISRHIAGKAYAKQGRDSLAMQYYQAALGNAKAAAIKQQIAFNLVGIGEVLNQQGKPNQALEPLAQAVVLAKEAKAAEPLQDALKALQNAQERLGNYQQALAHHKQYDLIKDSLFVLERANYISLLQVEYDTEKQQQLIALREKDLRNQRLVTYALAGVGVAVALLAMVMFWGRRAARRANQLQLQKNAEINQQKEEIQAQAEQLNQSNLFKDQLFTIIAHDLRSPLAMLKNTLELLDGERLTDQEMAVFKTHLTEQYQHVDGVLTKLLEWAQYQMDNRLHRAHPVSFALHQVAEEALGLLRALAKIKNISLHNHLDGQIKVLADQDQTAAIVRNLVANAIRFTPAGGQVHLEAAPHNGSWRVAVRDTGVGIASEQMKRLFTLDGHFSTKDTNGNKGTGLGLLLCKDLVTQNGGEIWAESQPNQGSTFYFTLPKSAVA